jgi:exodeoxyribonuclease VII large subunit
MDLVNGLASGLQDAALRHIDQQSQNLDLTSARLGRPSERVARERLRLVSNAQRLQFLSPHFVREKKQDLQRLQGSLQDALQRDLRRKEDLLQQAGVRLELLDPTLVLRRGYTWLTSAEGQTITSVRQTRVGQLVRATLADGEVDLTVSASK